MAVWLRRTSCLFVGTGSFVHLLRRAPDENPGGKLSTMRVHFRRQSSRTVQPSNTERTGVGGETVAGGMRHVGVVSENLCEREEYTEVRPKQPQADSLGPGENVFGVHTDQTSGVMSLPHQIPVEICLETVSKMTCEEPIHPGVGVSKRRALGAENRSWWPLVP